MSRLITPQALKELIVGGGELALLDVREEGVFSDGHMLYACPLPLSRFELSILDLVPRRATPVVLCDDDDGLSARAAAALARFGYSDVSVLDGGLPAWAAAGFVVFSGVNVPSKAFGEFVEVNYHTPDISAEDLNQKIIDGVDMVVLDSRPFDEYQRMSIPTGIDVPGAELVHRVHDLAPSPETLVVVNCAGRTRSIIGAQSLINAGIANPVVALRNGTMGYKLAGLEIDKGRDKRALTSTPEGTAKALEAAARVADRFGVQFIDQATLENWKAEREDRTLYVFDVRNPEEYDAGHMPGSLSAPGGQLVQGTDQYAVTRNARLVLIDDNGVRATMTASWLLQLGWRDVVVLDGGLEDVDLENGQHTSDVAGLDDADAKSITPTDLQAKLEGGNTVLIDCGKSLAYHKGHIAGAWFAVRSRLAQSLEKIPDADLLVITSDDGLIARFAATEAASLTATPVQYLEGGTAAWADAGLALVSGEEHMADEPEDMWLKPYDRSTGIEEAMNAYLDWEIGLVDQINEDGTTNFRLFD